MPRPSSIADADLFARLGSTFRDVGYEGASLTLLSKATGLKRASLYHRFPNGKQQMAEEVLSAGLAAFETDILAPLRTQAPPAQRIATVVRELDKYYSGGRYSCLLNMLAAPQLESGPFSDAISSAFEAIISAFAKLARDAGHDTKAARLRAERTVMLLHGSLVLSRGIRSTKPFKSFLAGLADELIGTPRNSLM